MRRDPKAFRERFAAWKNGKDVYKDGRPTDLYLDTMEGVARKNAENWGVSEDEALLHAMNDNSYDYQGYYNKYPESAADSRSHWTDEFKTVYHPTFSNESRYHGKRSKYNPYGLRGGMWVGDKYIPAPWQSKGKAFRLNKLGYAEGKDALPGFTGGYDEDALIDYLGTLENPTKHGLKNGIWRPPTDSTKWDVNLIGMGLDMRQEHNPIVYNFLKSKGRLNNPYLTESEERELRRQTWQQKKPILERFIKDKDLSERGILTAAGMLWQGHPYKMMNTPDSVTGKALIKALETGDKDLSTVFDAYYKYPANAKRYASRINSNTNRWNSHPYGEPVEDPVSPTFSRPAPPLDFTTPRVSTDVNLPFRRVAADNQVNNTAGWKALNHFETLDILKDLDKGYNWKLPKLPPLFPLDANQWTKSLIGYRGGKDSLPGYTTGEDGGFLNWLKNAVIGASVADAPAVATASGWHNEDGLWRQNRTAADELLGLNLSVLSTFSPTHPLTAATEKALLVAGRTLKMLRGPFVADIMDIETPIAPNIDQLTREALKDYTMAGGGKRFNELLYQNYLRGYDVPGLRVSTPRTKKDIPEEMVKIYKNSVEPRLKAQREWMNAEDISRGIDNALSEGYSVYDDAIFNRAGHPDWEKGFYNPKTGRISIRNGYEDFAVGHEVRHRVDDMRVPLVESEENLLNASFTDDFKNLSNTVEELKGVNMSEEMVTTNFDGRKKLLGRDVLKRVSVPKQNKMIDEATYDEMVESMAGANGYGKRYVEALINKYGRVPDKLIKAWKESYKHVGMLTGAAAVAKTKKKQLK